MDKINILPQTTNDLYRLCDIIEALIPELGYKYISFTGDVTTQGMFTNSKAFESKDRFKLAMRSDPDSIYSIHISGVMDKQYTFHNYLRCSIIKLFSNTFYVDVSCKSDNDAKQLQFMELVEDRYNNPIKIENKKVETKAVSPTEKATPRTSKRKYDVFVSHASVDKQTFVSDLVLELKSVTSDVWYDKNMIKWGDSIKGKIYEGLEQCEFGIVVFSKSYIGREWTEKELKELLEKQNTSKQNVILPIFLNDIPEEELRKQYPFLGDMLYIKQSEHDIKDIVIMFAERLIERLKSKL